MVPQPTADEESYEPANEYGEIADPEPVYEETENIGRGGGSGGGGNKRLTAVALYDYQASKWNKRSKDLGALLDSCSWDDIGNFLQTCIKNSLLH